MKSQKNRLQRCPSIFITGTADCDRQGYLEGMVTEGGFYSAIVRSFQGPLGWTGCMCRYETIWLSSIVAGL